MNTTKRFEVLTKQESRVKALTDLGFIFNKADALYFYLGHKITTAAIEATTDDQFFEFYYRIRDEITGKNRLPKN